MQAVQQSILLRTALNETSRRLPLILGHFFLLLPPPFLALLSVFDSVRRYTESFCVHFQCLINRKTQIEFASAICNSEREQTSVRRSVRRALQACAIFGTVSAAMPKSPRRNRFAEHFSFVTCCRRVKYRRRIEWKIARACPDFPPRRVSLATDILPVKMTQF